MKKFFISILFFVFFFLPSVNAAEIDKLIRDFDFNILSTVGILVQNSDGNILYKKNEKKLLNPASTLKLITFGASYLELGSNYKFETSLYQDNQNNIYLKLGGDTLLTQEDLNKLFALLKTKINTTKIKNIYVDDTIIDKTPYPNGWMKDDIWPVSRTITPYIVDRNFVKITINRSSLATKVDIIQNEPYKIALINELVLGDEQNIKIERVFGENSPIVTFKGTVVKDEVKTLPVVAPDVNFNIKTRKAIDKNQIKYLNIISAKKTPQGAKKIASVSHSIEEISKDILYNSDNFVAEVVFKVAGAKHINYSHPATFDDALAMFEEKFPLEEGISIIDASGASRYNLVNCEFMNKVLVELFKKEDYKKLLATSNQGTLKDRLLFLNGNLRAKTGTLSKMSSIAGTLKTKKGRNVVFTIVVKNSPKRRAVLKNFEDSVITTLYRKY